MLIAELMKKKQLTMYRLSKESGVPYATVNDICSGKTELPKCSAETIYKLSKVLGVSMEELLEPYMEERIDFELFKSNECHRLKNLGDIEFVIEVLEKDEIRRLYQRQWHRESLYLLGLLDYVCRENEIPQCTEYDEFRKMKLKKTLFPASVTAAATVNKDESIKQKAIRDAIPEFMRFNIVESEVRNVI